MVSDIKTLTAQTVSAFTTSLFGPQDTPGLSHLIHHHNSTIRELVARKIDPSALPEMIEDRSPLVRSIVASRIDESWLPKMVYDSASKVVDEVLERAPYLADKVLLSADPLVRLRVAESVSRKYLACMILRETTSTVRCVLISRI